MKKFLVLYQSTIPAAEQIKMATPEMAQAGMQAWMTWAGQAGSAIVDMGSPLGSVARFDAPARRAQSSSQIGGYSILQAESKEALAALLNEHPHFHAPGASIEVLEFLQMPGM